MRNLIPMLSAIVLASGLSKRMGSEDKLQLDIGGEMLLERVLEQLRKANIDEIILVGSFQIISQFSASKLVENNAPSKGMGHSIRLGLEAISDQASNFMICLGDMPGLTSEDYNCLINHHLNSNQKGISVPYFEGKRGNPVVFSNEFKNEILRSREKDGCKAMILKHSNLVNPCEFKNDHILLDIDTPGDYKRYKA